MFISIVIFTERMIVVSNTYIPSLSKKVKKDQKLLATTEAGDVAYYTSLKRKNKLIEELDNDDDDDDNDDDDEMYDSDDTNDDDDDDDEDKKKKKMLKKKKQKKTKKKGLEFGIGTDSVVESFSGADWRPNFSDRMTMFIAGTPGAGKSYLAKQMINLLPKNLEILLFTALEEEDGNFSELGKDRIYKIKMTPENLTKITLKEIRERAKARQIILLFDDVDKIRDPKVQNHVFAIMNDALANGRGHEKHDGDHDIHVLCTSHSLNDYQKTKYTFENSNYVALFPGTTPPLQMYRMFDKLGLDKKLCYKMIKLGRKQQIRSVIIHKVVPMYMIYGNKIMLL